LSYNPQGYDPQIRQRPLAAGFSPLYIIPQIDPISVWNLHCHLLHFCCVGWSPKPSKNNRPKMRW
jgi:hypothetical protein